MTAPPRTPADPRVEAAAHCLNAMTDGSTNLAEARQMVRKILAAADAAAWQAGPPQQDDLALLEIEFRHNGRPERETIVGYVDESGDLKAMCGDDIGWPEEVVIRHAALPAPPTADSEDSA